MTSQDNLRLRKTVQLSFVNDMWPYDVGNFSINCAFIDKTIRTTFFNSTSFFSKAIFRFSFDDSLQTEESSRSGEATWTVVPWWLSLDALAYSCCEPPVSCCFEAVSNCVEPMPLGRSGRASHCRQSGSVERMRWDKLPCNAPISAYHLYLLKEWWRQEKRYCLHLVSKLIYRHTHWCCRRCDHRCPWHVPLLMRSSYFVFLFDSKPIWCRLCLMSSNGHCKFRRSNMAWP